MTEPIVALSNVNKVYRTDRMETIALQDVSVAVEPGEFVAVMGPSGCGKSTLLNLLGLIDRPTEGAVLFRGEDVSGLADRRLAPIRNRELGFRSEEHTSELQSRENLVCRLLLV